MKLLYDILCDPTYGRDAYTRAIVAQFRERVAPAMETRPKFRFTIDLLGLAYESRHLDLHPTHDFCKGNWYEVVSDGEQAGFLVDESNDRNLLMFVRRPDGGIADFIVRPLGPDWRKTEVHCRPPFDKDPKLQGIISKLISYMLICIALMQAPKIVVTTPSPPADPALQRARLRRGRPPLSEFSEVTIHVTRREREARQEAAEHFERTGKRLHLCRSYVRVLNGKPIRVQEHWRGDASKGLVRARNYRVTI